MIQKITVSNPNNEEVNSFGIGLPPKQPPKLGNLPRHRIPPKKPMKSPTHHGPMQLQYSAISIDLCLMCYALYFRRIVSAQCG